MSVDKLVDSTQLDSDLTSVANAIRTKGGTNSPLAFPSDFVSAINALQVFHEYSGSVANFTTASATNLLKLSVAVEPVQSGSGTPSPDNVRPISGWDEVNIWVHPTHDTTASPTATIDLNGTRYGGTLDVITGVLTVDRAHVTLDGTHPIQLVNWRPTATSVGWAYNYATFSDCAFVPVSKVGNIISDKLKTASYNNAYNGDYDAMIAVFSGSPYSFFVRFPDTSLTTAAKINTYLSANPINFVYELATPVTVQLNPETVSTLAGTNNVWADAGDITLWYAE